MSRYADHAGQIDPLQRRRAVATARAAQSASPHSWQSGLIAIAPRLALVFLVASAIQMLMHWSGR
jgi:hypothetical protein